jgi:hypothetical protein
MTTLEKVKRLERYIAADNSTVDPVVDVTIEKLLNREQARLLELKARLEEQLAEFQKKYALDSSEFTARYEQGVMGDDMDFVEWAATVEMLANVEARLTLLGKEQA